jgi:hypothetical protein
VIVIRNSDKRNGSSVGPIEEKDSCNQVEESERLRDAELGFEERF